MKLRNILLFTTLMVTLLSSCSKFNTLLKGTDLEAKYQEAIRLYDEKKYSKAITLFENIIPNLTGTPREDTIMFYMGKAAFNRKDYALSGEIMNVYRDRFSRSVFTQEAEYLYAMSYYKQSAPPEKDQTETRHAIIAFNEYLNRYPNSIQNKFIQEYIQELTYKLYYKTYINAILYSKLGRYNGAVTALKSAIKEYPEIPYREEMTYLICRSWFDYAENSIFSRQLDRYLKTIDAYYNFITQYPDNTQFRKDLDKMYAKAKEFSDTFGARAMAAEQNITSIELHKANIEQLREKLFDVDTKVQRQEVYAGIKKEKMAITKLKTSQRHEQQNAKKEEKQLKLYKAKDKKSNGNQEEHTN